LSLEKRGGKERKEQRKKQVQVSKEKENATMLTKEKVKKAGETCFHQLRRNWPRSIANEAAISKINNTPIRTKGKMEESQIAGVKAKYAIISVAKINHSISNKLNDGDEPI
jgi:hypothetical protein